MIVNGIWRTLGRWEPEKAVALVDRALGMVMQGVEVLATTCDVVGQVRFGSFLDRVGFLEKQARSAGFDAKLVEVPVSVSKTNGHALMPLSALIEARDGFLGGRATLARDLGYAISDDSAMAVVEKLIERTDLEVERLRRSGVRIANAGQHFGKVLAVGEGMVIQDAGQGRQVAHRASSLNAIPVPGQSMEVRYQGNGLALVRGSDRGLDTGRGR